ncbi:hypothetical protein THAOC_03376 [Thalassiosira oceanica]|uniref:Uncharacterized protein n=1 Tax=Thalassiosira oceanica TaxID=159749 RepID=K0TCK3_THAOC|nr:hypothetical protein THAOC_03376 [Thalassiosira oceanica]|eukprot:EJK74919.1 hypothetical protein THAOC_03376 [Thalassiosira oceanica]
MKVIHPINTIAAASVTFGEGSHVSESPPPPPQHRLLGSLDLFNSLFRTEAPRVEACFGGLVQDSETGERVPLITCDFSTCQRCNATAGIRVGRCDGAKEICSTELRDGGCAGPFVQTGKIRVDLYPELEDHELDAKHFNRTYCARADIFHHSQSVSHIKRELIINFAREQRVNVALDTTPDEVVVDGLNPATIFIGSFLGTVIALSAILRTTLHSSFPTEDINSMEDPEDDRTGRQEPDERRIDIV